MKCHFFGICNIYNICFYLFNFIYLILFIFIYLILFIFIYCTCSGLFLKN
nr:MAG TPA: hypothetical protein [Caudoviricetes sp.]